MNLTGWRKRVLCFDITIVVALLGSLAMLAGFLAAGYAPAAHGLDHRGVQIGRDFINVWIAPHLAADGDIAALFDLKAYTAAAGERFGQAVPNCYWSYPPNALVVYYPFSILPYFPSLALWTFCGIAATIAVFRIWYPQKPWAVLALVLAPACLINLLSGQNGFLTAALLIGGLLAIKRHPVLAGVAFGILTFKPQLGLVLPFALIAMRAWKPILSACVTSIAIGAVSMLAFGLDIWKQYFADTAKVEMAYLYHFKGFYAVMIQSPYAGFRRVGFNYFDAIALQVGCALAVVALVVAALRRTDDVRQQAFIVVTAVPLVTPYIFNYDLVLLAIPLACIVWPGSGATWWQRTICLVAWFAPMLAMAAGASRFPVLQAFAPIGFAALFWLAISHRVSMKFCIASP